jgi:hypothetical protein
MINTYGRSSKDTHDFTRKLLLNSFDGLLSTLIEKINKSGLEIIYEEESSIEKVFDRIIIPENFDWSDESQCLLKFIFVLRSYFEDMLDEEFPDLKVDAKSRAKGLLRLCNILKTSLPEPDFEKFALSIFPNDAKKAAKKELCVYDPIRKIKKILNTYNGEGVPYLDVVSERAGITITQLEKIINDDDSLQINEYDGRRFVVINS